MSSTVIGRDDTEVAAPIAGQRRTFADLPGDIDAWAEAGSSAAPPTADRTH